MPDPSEPTPRTRDAAYYAGLSASMAAGAYTVAGPVEPGPGHRAIPEHSRVELLHGIQGIPAGTRGTVVGVYSGGGYEVEVTRDGQTIAVVTVGAADIHPVETSSDLAK